MNKSKTMKAALLLQPGQFSIVEKPIPLPQKGEMLIRVHSCCLCGSDLRTFIHGNPRTKLPAVIGHEISGTVAATGTGCPFHEGERVALGADLPVAKDFWSDQGRPNLAEPNIALGYQVPGGLAEYCLISELCCLSGPVTRIPQHLDLTAAALAEPLACCINACENTGIKTGERVLIFGAGPIGMLLGMTCLALGAAQVVLTDPVPERIEMAKNIGLTDAFLLPENIYELQDHGVRTQQGFNAVFTACISPEAIKPAIESLSKRGRLCLFAGYPKPGAQQLDPNIIHYKELNLCGAHGSTPEQHHRAIALISSGKIATERIITHHFPLEKITEAIKTAQNRRCLKVAIHP